MITSAMPIDRSMIWNISMNVLFASPTWMGLGPFASALAVSLSRSSFEALPPTRPSMLSRCAAERACSIPPSYVRFRPSIKPPLPFWSSFSPFTSCAFHSIRSPRLPLAAGSLAWIHPSASWHVIWNQVRSTTPRSSAHLSSLLGTCARFPWSRGAVAAHSRSQQGSSSRKQNAYQRTKAAHLCGQEKLAFIFGSRQLRKLFKLLLLLLLLLPVLWLHEDVRDDELIVFV